MAFRALFVSSAAFLASGAAQAQPPMSQSAPIANLLINGDLEAQVLPEAQLTADGWHVDGASPDLALDTQQRAEGSAALRISYRSGFNENGYSGILQKVDVTALRGKTLRYEAMVRKDQAASEAGLWLMLRGPNKEKLFYINSYDDKLPTGSWERRTLEVLVPDTATTTLVGASIYEADGTMWIDDARLTVAS